jgi:hypothetical protein
MFHEESCDTLYPFIDILIEMSCRHHYTVCSRFRILVVGSQKRERGLSRDVLSRPVASRVMRADSRGSTIET